ncbi:hypothetical protein BVC80_7657g3 [Macleaya cordata]|uniref:RNase H type-1 domain-containing protein n=1 Tax=Macleaya cordata TaxID=56857 RepID=A0A200R7V7_MACCD|nr:hypothetical protein BVC80_7657g3 [Macleaya cordata]
MHISSRINFQLQQEFPSLQHLLIEWLNYHDDFKTFNLGCCILWNIWKARNKCVFEHKNPDVSLVLRNAVKDFEEFHSLEIFVSDVTSIPLVPIPTLRSAYWIHPIQPYLKINIDGAFRDNSGAASAVAMDSFGCYQGCGTCWFPASSALIAEARAYLHGVQLAQRLHVSHCIIEGDAEAITRFLSGSEDGIPWQIRTIVLNIKFASQTFTDIRFTVVPREANIVAHELVQFAFQNHVTDWWSPTAPPDCISHSHHQDRVLV